MAQRKRGRVGLKGFGKKDPTTGKYPKYYWYVFINEDKNEKGEYPVRSYNTWLTERGNKKKAEKILVQKIAEYEEELASRKEDLANNNNIATKDITFIDYLYKYVEKKKVDITPMVYNTYKDTVRQLETYFTNIAKTNPYLSEVKAKHINDYYDYLRGRTPQKGKTSGIKITTLKHIANVIRPALKRAYIDELIPTNPYDKVQKLKRDIREEPDRPYFNEEELINFLEILETHPLGYIYKICMFLGLRRSELLGLKYSNIDFVNKTIAIKGSVLKVNGEFLFPPYNKTESSTDTLVMNDIVVNLLQERKRVLMENINSFGNSYNTKYLDYVFVNDMGELYDPDYISKTLKNIIKKFGLKDIHLHSLRHSYCSLLYEKTNDIELVKEMMRHTNIKTTMLYLHRNHIEVKQKGANAIYEALNKNYLVKK